MYAGYLPFLFRKENFNYFFVVDFSLVFLVGITKHKPRESVKSRRKKISPASSIQDSKNIIIVFEITQKISISTTPTFLANFGAKFEMKHFE